jgi:hypothetical protein
MNFCDQLRAAKERELRARKHVAQSRSNAKQKRIAVRTQDIVQRCKNVAQEAASRGEDNAKLRIVDEAIPLGAFWLSDKSSVDELELSACGALEVLKALGLRARYDRQDMGNEFRPVISLNGW